MKKISLLLSLIFATIFSGCEAEKDYISDKSLNQNYQLKRISFSEFKSNQSAFQKLREARSKKNPNILNRGVYNEDYGVFIDTTNIVVVENDGKHSITFQIIDEAFSNKVENLVLNSKDDGYVAYITEYLLSQQELQALGNGGELLSKEPDAITMLENNARISISGNGAHCVDVITVITRYCEDINGKVIENKGEGCYGGFFEVEHQVLTISEGCLSNGGGSSGGIGGYNPPTSGGNPVSGGGGSTGGSTGNTNPDINDGNPNPIITTPVLNQSKTEIKLLNTFSDEQLDWWNNEADEEVKEDILAYINQFLTLEQNEAIEFANELIDLAVNETEQEDVHNLVNLSILIEDCSDEEFFTDEFAQKLVQYTDISLTTLPPNYPISLLSIKTLLNYKKLRQLNPEWSRSKCIWEATKEIVHLSLDAFGLIPVGGEIADLINGVLYTIEGDKLNATLSYASAVPVTGWATASVKFAIKIKDVSQTAYTVSTKVKLVWKNVDGVIKFGDRGQLRKVLGMGTSAVDARQAHHIIPWAKQSHPAVQKAAKSSNAFHMNEALNGIPLNTAVHSGSHSNYDNLVQGYLDAIPNTATPDQAYNAINTLINNIRTAIQNNPTTPINQLSF